MTKKTLLPFAALVAAALAASLHAQQPTPSAVPLSGPVVPGVCMLSQQAVFANSKIGQAATARLRQLSQQEQSRLDAQGRPLDADLQAFRSQAASLKEGERQTREKSLNDRMNAFRAQREQSLRDIQATRLYAVEQIGAVTQPLLADVFKAQKCGLLLDRNAVLGGNTTNDLTPQVIKALDARASTIQFGLQHAPPATSN